eukprot:1808083-Prymnesium_polylepis.1
MVPTLTFVMRLNVRPSAFDADAQQQYHARISALLREMSGAPLINVSTTVIAEKYYQMLVDVEVRAVIDTDEGSALATADDLSAASLASLSIALGQTVDDVSNVAVTTTAQPAPSPPPPAAPPKPPPIPPPIPPSPPPLTPPPPPLIAEGLRVAFALGMVVPLLAVIICFMVFVFLRTLAKPAFSAAEREALRVTWMPSTLLRVLQERPEIEAITAELVPIATRTKHFYAPNEILGGASAGTRTVLRLCRRLLSKCVHASLWRQPWVKASTPCAPPAA